VTVNQVITTLEDLIGRGQARSPRLAGRRSASHLGRCLGRAAGAGFRPKVALRDGLAAEVAWLREIVDLWPRPGWTSAAVCYTKVLTKPET